MIGFVKLWLPKWLASLLSGFWSRVEDESNEAGSGERRGQEGRTHFAGFVLRDFVLCVLLAVFAFAVGPAGFGYIDLWREVLAYAF